MAQINKDVEALEKHLIPSDRMAEEHALDMKYLRERQQPFGCDLWEI